jgi:chromosome segregation ATPase
MLTHTQRVMTAVAVVTLLVGSEAFAQASKQQDEREREARRRAQQAVTRMQEERDAAIKENTAMEAKLAAANATAARQERELARLRSVVANFEASTRAARELASTCEATASANARDVQQLKGENEALADRLRDADTRMQALQMRARSVIAEISSEAEKRLATERVASQATLTAQTEQTAACEQKNIGLAKFGFELIDRFEKRSGWNILRTGDPVFRFRTVEEENLLESYRDRIDELRIPLKKR